MSSADPLDSDTPSYVLCNNDTLRKAARNLGRLYDDVLMPSALRNSQFSVLVHIDALEKPTIKDLANELVMDESALGHTLKPLIRDGLVRLAPHPKDKRAKLVTLTKAGQRKFEETTALWLNAQGNMEELLGKEQAKALREALLAIASPEFSLAFEKLNIYREATGSSL